MNTETS